MATSSTQLGDLEALTEKIRELHRVLSDEALQDLKLPPQVRTVQGWIDRVAQQHAHSSHRFTIMVLGKFNAGKSTLLNALLELPAERALPVGHRPTTAKPLRLSYRRPGDPDAYWLLSDGRKIERSWNEALEAGHQDGEAADDESIEELQLFISHPLLYRADILDMPGTGTANYQAHTEKTREYLAHSEMVMWVIGSQEPDKIGREDVLLAIDNQVPITAVFNAWGSLDEEDDRYMALDQDEFEAGVREHFADVFSDPSVATFRVYARKCRESQAQRLSSIPVEFGLTGLQHFLHDNYVESFGDKANKRRMTVRFQVDRIVDEVLTALYKARDSWDEALLRQDNAGQALRDERHAIYSLEHRIEERLYRLADAQAGTILEHMSGQIERFIKENIQPTNLRLWRKAANQDKLEAELGKQIREQYLHLNRPNNWLEQQLSGYVRSSNIVLRAEWSRFLDRMEIEMPQRAPDKLKVDLPFDTVAQGALATVKQTVLGLAITGAAVGTLITVPVINVVASLIFLGALPFVGQKMEDYRESTIRSTRDDLFIQRPGVTVSLLDVILEGPHAELKANFQEHVGKREELQSRRAELLDRGLEALNKLMLDLETRHSSVER